MPARGIGLLSLPRRVIPGLAMYHSDLGNSLFIWFELTGQGADLDSGINCWQHANQVPAVVGYLVIRERPHSVPRHPDSRRAGLGRCHCHSRPIPWMPLTGTERPWSNNAKLCCNGNEYAECMAARAGIGFTPLDNGFAAVDDAAAVQAICDGFDERAIWGPRRQVDGDLTVPVHRGRRGGRVPL